VKNDPALAAKARELRDRWMERLNQHPATLLGAGKYDVARLIQTPAVADGDVHAAKMLAA
jgi:hypothetical protein